LLSAVAPKTPDRAFRGVMIHKERTPKLTILTSTIMVLRRPASSAFFAVVKLFSAAAIASARDPSTR